MKAAALRHLTPLRGRRESATDRAFESFYREHVAEVYQYALAVLSNPADAEDVTQQTFLNAYRAFKNGERPHAPHNWLIKIAHNVCRMRWRQSSRRPQEVALENAAEPARADEDKPSLDDVLQALARLPFNQRAAVVMREVEGRTYADIAEVLGTTVPAVEALLFRARTNLRARRKALGVLTLVPVPGSLSSFFGSGGAGILAAGGAAIGGDFLLKAAAVVATSVVAGGLGFKTVTAIAKPEQARLPIAVRSHRPAPAWANPVQRVIRARVAADPQLAPGGFAHPAQGHAANAGLRRLPADDNPSDPGRKTSDASSAAASGSGSPVPAAADVAGTQPGETVRKIVASVPTPTVPPTPPAPVQVPVPVPPPPALPPVTVTVPTVTLPPPPPIK
jgi:RNA polymerase sigma factor (sigma-70 family)